MRMPLALALALPLGLLLLAPLRAEGPAAVRTRIPPPVSGEAPPAGLVSLGLHLDRAEVLSEKGQVLHGVVELEVVGGERPDRKPLALSIVLDVSGSMEGESKLAHVIEATEFVLDRLGREDRVAIVAYETGTHEVYLPDGAPDAAAGRRALAKLRPLGGTNMEAGLRLGLAKLEGLGEKRAARRLLLLSDGQANQGISTAEGLSAIAARAREQGASVSTFGVGADYNEDLMAAIAEAAGGNYHVIDRGQELAEVFRKEFDELGSLVGSQVALGLDLPEGLTLREAYGYPLREKSGKPSIVLRDLFHGMRTKVVLRFEVGADAPEKGPGELSAHLGFADARDARERGVAARATWRWSRDHRAAAKSVDPRVKAIVEEVRGAEELERATRAYAEGRLEEAQELLQKRILQNRAVQSEVGEDAARLEAQNSFLEKTMQSFQNQGSASRSGRAAVKASKQGARLFRY